MIIINNTIFYRKYEPKYKIAYYAYIKLTIIYLYIHNIQTEGTVERANLTRSADTPLQDQIRILRIFVLVTHTWLLLAASHSEVQQQFLRTTPPSESA